MECSPTVKHHTIRLLGRKTAKVFIELTTVSVSDSSIIIQTIQQLMRRANICHVGGIFPIIETHLVAVSFPKRGFESQRFGRAETEQTIHLFTQIGPRDRDAATCFSIKTMSFVAFSSFVSPFRCCLSA